MLLWGSAFPSSRWAVGHVPHQVAALMRFGGGAVVLLAIVARRRPPLPSLRQVLPAAIAGLVGVFAYNGLFFWGVSLAPASDGSIMVPTLSPVFTICFLVLTGGETACRRRVVGLVVAVLGSAVFFAATAAGAADRYRLLGDAIFVAAALLWATYTVINRRILRSMDPLVGVTIATLAGSLALTATAAPSLAATPLSSLGAGFWLNMAYLAVGPTAVAYLLYVRGIRDAGASTSSMMMFSVPVFGTVLSMLFLHESFGWAQALAALVMLGGAAVAVLSHETAKPSPVESAGRTGPSRHGEVPRVSR